LISTQKPVVWIGEPAGFCDEAKRILENSCEVVYQKISEVDLPDVFDSCDVFIFRLGFKIQEEDLKLHQRCKIIATPVTGLDHIDLKACDENNIKIISLKGEFDFLQEVRATAEFTFALILSLIRNIIQATLDVKQSEFNRDAFRGHELYQKKMGIIGFGRLGKMVAQYAKAFGMNVLIHEIDSSKVPLDSDYKFLALDDLLYQADFITLHVDAHENNAMMVNEEFLSKMKRNSYLINTSRGSLIDESALVYALENELISGAALDVVQGEPDVDFDNRLFEYNRTHSNLLITPHLGGNTFESCDKTECFIANKIIDKLFHA
jgi:D-3-phosphoglycerate dehydrogenase